MKLPCAATSLLMLASGGLHAQSLTLYGLLDTGVEVVNHVGATGASLKRMPGQTGSLPSRLGFRGSEDLGGGWAALFTPEQGLLLDGGTLGQGGRAFGRQSFVGITGPWGTFSAGRQYTMTYWSLLEADILGPAIYSSSSLDSYIPNARADNALAWRGTFAGFTFGATYSLGRDTVNAGPSPGGTNCAGEDPTDATTCREWSALAKYDGAAWGAALAVDTLHGGAGAFGGLTSADKADRRVSANGYLKFGSTKIGAGLIRRDNEGSATTPRSDLWYLGVSYPFAGVWALNAEAFRLAFKDSDNRATLFAAQLTYALSKRTLLYGTAGHIRNDGALALSVSAGAPGSAPAPGVGQSGVMLGLRHSF